MLALLGGLKAKLIAAGLALAAIAGMIWSIFAKGKRAGRHQAERKQKERIDDATERKDTVRDPGDRGSIDRMRDGDF